jgi:hypothetical protein
MSGLRSALRQESQPVSAQAFASGRVLGRDILVIVLAGLLINALLIAIPGFYSHDELDWRTMISQGRSDWSFGLGSFTQSPFFRLLGTIVISASLRLPVQPVGAHFVETTIGIASACFLYRAVSLFRPDRALASAILFMAMPGFAFDVGWVGAGFDVQFTFWGVISVLCGILYWRGGRPWLLAASAVAFAAAMGCKETAMAIPICAAIVMWVDYKNVDRRRAGWLIGVIAVVVVLYFGLNAKRLIFTSAAGSGGYALGDRWLFLRHIAPYFGFPFAYKMPEISNFPIGDAGAAFLLCLPHILLVAVILLRAGPKWAVIYILLCTVNCLSHCLGGDMVKTADRGHPNHRARRYPGFPCFFHPESYVRDRGMPDTSRRYPAIFRSIRNDLRQSGHTCLGRCAVVDFGSRDRQSHSYCEPHANGLGHKRCGEGEHGLPSRLQRDAQELSSGSGPLIAQRQVVERVLLTASEGTVPLESGQGSSCPKSKIPEVPATDLS